MLRINNLSLSLDDALTKEKELYSLQNLIQQKYHIHSEEIISLSIARKAIDARRNKVKFIYNVNVSLQKEEPYIKKYKEIDYTKKIQYEPPHSGDKSLQIRPMIIGFGPAGIFAGLLLAEQGYRPLILERGLDVDTRTKHWEEFLKTGQFKETGSILFGEGGAGTFSDGKLTTLKNDYRSQFILNTLVDAGADEEILYLNRPHIGTDMLKGVIKNIRKRIEQLGGEVRFGHFVTDFVIEDNKLNRLVINHNQTIDCEVVLMGIGHSARETFKTLYEKQVLLQKKPFSMGVRIEHPQKLINKAQYGSYANHKALGAADYKLSYHAKNGRTAYTFCMCPGGFVVSSVSEPGMVATNGMSLHARDNDLANSALLVNVTPSDFPSEHPLAGMHLQQTIERKAFQLAGKNNNAPVQLVEDFMGDKLSKSLGQVIPSYKPGFAFVKMSDVLPHYVTDTLKEALVFFDGRINGFAMNDAVLTGPETRSSSPVRIMRNDLHESNIIGLFPMGEGAGYAGGIMSSAIDGMKTAEHLIQQYKPFE